MVRQLPHEPYRRILVPVDFSEWSRSAIELARQIAPEASLVLMHAVELPFEGKMRTAGVAEDTVMRYRDTARREAQQRLRGVAVDAGLDTDIRRGATGLVRRRMAARMWSSPQSSLLSMMAIADAAPSLSAGGPPGGFSIRVNGRLVSTVPAPAAGAGGRARRSRS